MSKFAIVTLVTFASLSSALADQGDASRGERDFRACGPCHYFCRAGGDQQDDRTAMLRGDRPG
jgi:cytochrome c2